MTDRNAGTFEKVVATVSRTAFLAYLVGTGLGLIYAYSFYKTFDIEFLSFASPLDLLFVSLANANKVVLILLLALALPVLALLVIAMLIAVAVWFSAVIVFLWLTGVLLRAAICFVWFLWFTLAIVLSVSTILLIFFPVVTVFLCMAAMASIRRALAAFQHDGTRQHLSTVSFGPYRTFLEKPMSIAKTAWSSTVAAASNVKKRFKEFRCKVMTWFKRVQKLFLEFRSAPLRTWKPILKPILIVVLVALPVTVAWRSGVVDAECVVGNDPVCESYFGGSKGSRSNIGEYVKRLLPLQSRSNSSASSAARVFIVPTANVAAIEFLPGLRDLARTNDRHRVGTKESARKQVSLTIRQDAQTVGSTNLPKCLTYVGATETAQFLVDFEDDDSELAQREECHFDKRPDSGNRCDLAARIGPFASGQATMSGITETDEGKPCDRARLTDVSGLIEEINSRGEKGQLVERMLLIGRADSWPIDNSSFRSNSGLAQARAEWVWRRLLSAGWKRAEDIHVVRLTAGPIAHGDPPDACDRSVEVHICWEQAEPVGEAPLAGLNMQ